LIETDKDGIIIKADTIGSLEALTNMLREHKIPVRKASIGNLTKKDVAEAEANFETDKFSAVILGFNITASDEIKAMSERVHIFTHDVIYSLVDAFEKWKLEQEEKEKTKELDTVVRPCKIKIMENYVEVMKQFNVALDYITEELNKRDLSFDKAKQLVGVKYGSRAWLGANGYKPKDKGLEKQLCIEVYDA